jgi:hypothetical protein
VAAAGGQSRGLTVSWHAQVRAGGVAAGSHYFSRHPVAADLYAAAEQVRLEILRRTRGRVHARSRRRLLLSLGGGGGGGLWLNGRGAFQDPERRGLAWAYRHLVGVARPKGEAGAGAGGVSAGGWGLAGAALRGVKRVVDERVALEGGRLGVTSEQEFRSWFWLVPPRE